MKCKVKKILSLLPLVILSCCVLVPLFVLFSGAFGDAYGLGGTAFSGIGFFLENSTKFYKGMANTLRYAFPVSAARVIVGALIGWLISDSSPFKLNKKVKRAFSLFFVTLALVPAVAFVVFYLKLASLNELSPSFFGYAVTQCVFPCAVLIIRTGFDTVDKSVIEAASLDGSDGVHLLVRIVLPCVRKYISLAFFVSFIDCINMTCGAIHLIDSADRLPLSVMLREAVENSPETVAVPALLYAVIPLCIFVLSVLYAVRDEEVFR